VSVNAMLRDTACPDGHMAVTNEKGTIAITSTRAMSSKSCAIPDAIEVRVPEHFDISIESNGGSVSIAGVSGKIDGHTSGGDVKLSHITGHVKLSTDGGDVDVEDSHLDGAVHTATGRVTFNGVTGGIHGTSDSDGSDVTVSAN
jgi:hypothetical protein